MIGVVVGMTVFSATAAVTIDIPAALERATLATSARVEALRGRLETAQAELDSLKDEHPEWSDEINRIVEQFNADDPAATRQAFEALDALMAGRREDLRLAEARSRVAQANLLYPFEVSKAEPLICAAAELAEQDFWYWIECGRARRNIGSLRLAEAALINGAEIAEANDPTGKEFAYSLSELGDIYALRGNLRAALANYLGAQSIIQKLFDEDPDNRGRIRDLSLSLERVGNVHMRRSNLQVALSAYDQSLALRRDLAARDPENLRWSRDVTVSLNKVGDVHRAKGALTDALTVYQESLQLRRDLAARATENAGSLRDVSVTLNKIGRVYRAQGDPAKALGVLEESLQLARDVAARDPMNAEWARDVWVSLWDIALIDETNAVAHWTEIVERIGDMKARDALLPTDERFLEEAKRKLKAAE